MAFQALNHQLSKYNAVITDKTNRPNPENKTQFVINWNYPKTAVTVMKFKPGTNKLNLAFPLVSSPHFSVFPPPYATHRVGP